MSVERAERAERAEKSALAEREAYKVEGANIKVKLAESKAESAEFATTTTR